MNSLNVHQNLINSKPKAMDKRYYLGATVPAEMYVEVKDYLREYNINQSKFIKTLIMNYFADIEKRLDDNK